MNTTDAEVVKDTKGKMQGKDGVSHYLCQTYCAGTLPDRLHERRSSAAHGPSQAR